MQKSFSPSPEHNRLETVKPDKTKLFTTISTQFIGKSAVSSVAWFLDWLGNENGLKIKAKLVGIEFRITERGPVVSPLYAMAGTKEAFDAARALFEKSVMYN